MDDDVVLTTAADAELPAQVRLPSALQAFTDVLRPRLQRIPSLPTAQATSFRRTYTWSRASRSGVPSNAAVIVLERTSVDGVEAMERGLGHTASRTRRSPSAALANGAEPSPFASPDMQAEACPETLPLPAPQLCPTCSYLCEQVQSVLLLAQPLSQPLLPGIAAATRLQLHSAALDLPGLPPPVQCALPHASSALATGAAARQRCGGRQRRRAARPWRRGR